LRSHQAREISMVRQGLDTLLGFDRVLETAFHMALVTLPSS